MIENVFVQHVSHSQSFFSLVAQQSHDGLQGKPWSLNITKHTLFLRPFFLVYLG